MYLYLRRIPHDIALSTLSFYQWFLSPLLPQACRFSPSCSRYAYEAIERYGLLKGGVLTLFRISKCHPFHPGGYDPMR